MEDNFKSNFIEWALPTPEISLPKKDDGRYDSVIQSGMNPSKNS